MLNSAKVHNLSKELLVDKKERYYWRGGGLHREMFRSWLTGSLFFLMLEILFCKFITLCLDNEKQGQIFSDFKNHVSICLLDYFLTLDFSFHFFTIGGNFLFRRMLEVEFPISSVLFMSQAFKKYFNLATERIKCAIYSSFQNTSS